MFKQFFFLALLALSFGKVEAQKEVITLDPEPEKQKALAEIFEPVDEMPAFPGCSEIDAKERKICSDKKMMAWVYSQVKYPEISRAYAAQGTVIVSFIVETDGSLSNVVFLKKILPQYDEAIHDKKEISARKAAAAALNVEALRVVRKMAAMPEKWTPAKRRGQTVKIKQNLPIRFKLN